jgi:hypothetical protein
MKRKEKSNLISKKTDVEAQQKSLKEAKKQELLPSCDGKSAYCDYPKLMDFPMKTESGIVFSSRSLMEFVRQCINMRADR